MSLLGLSSEEVQVSLEHCEVIFFCQQHCLGLLAAHHSRIATTVTEERKERKDYTVWHQSKEKPGNTPDCPENYCESLHARIVKGSQHGSLI